MRIHTWSPSFTMLMKEPRLSSDWRWKVTARAVLAASTILMCGTLSALATPQSTYVSPGKYRQYSCDQLLGAARNISTRATVLAGRKSDMASRDPVVAVPPVLQDAGPTTSELAGLKQELDAIEEAAIQGQCDIEFIRSN
jgi:hypothetical protein